MFSFHVIINFIHIYRTWEQWSYEDKAIFFEALNECGKNFEAIQVYFQKNNKNRLRGLKNKDQIRTFYYRTWHKICKYVDFTDDYKHLKKSSKELYSLINFGELRKRLGSQLDDKTGLKLRELIFKGHTSVKIKGKTHRLRTPTCLALKKLNEINGAGLNNSSSTSTTSSTNSEIFDPTTPSPIVPCKLSLNLSPASTEDFDRVHRLALANPNVTITSRPGKSLSSIIEYLMQKWKSSLDDAELWIVPKPGMNFEHPDISVIGPATLSLSSLKKDGDNVDEDSINSRETSNSEQQQNDLNGITKLLGWNMETAKSLSIGELFLIAGGGGGGNKSKIHLELNYTWKNPVTKSSSSSTNSTMSMLAKLALSELSKKKSQASAILSSSAPRTSKSNNNINNTLNIESSSQIESTCSERLRGGDLDTNTETHEFRRPTLPLSKTGIQQHQAFKQQIETLMPKYNMRKGRPLSRLKRPALLQPVSKRPLQPAPAMKSTEGQVKFRILPNHHQVAAPSSSSSSPPSVINIKSPFGGAGSTMTTTPTETTIAVVTPPPSVTLSTVTSATSTTPSRNIDLDPGNSNDSISSALAFFEPQAQNNQRLTSKTDHFLDSVLENSNSSVLQTPPRVRPTPPTSPSRAVSNDSWIPDLSSFLNNIHPGGGSSNKDHHHQSRIINNDNQHNNKNNIVNVVATNEDSVQSNGSEVDRQLLSMMSESSVDFTSKFAKLASAVVGHEDDNVKDA